MQTPFPEVTPQLVSDVYELLERGSYDEALRLARGHDGPAQLPPDFLAAVREEREGTYVNLGGTWEDNPYVKGRTVDSGGFCRIPRVAFMDVFEAFASGDRKRVAELMEHAFDARDRLITEVTKDRDVVLMYELAGMGHGGLVCWRRPETDPGGAALALQLMQKTGVDPIAEVIKEDGYGNLCCAGDSTSVAAFVKDGYKRIEPESFFQRALEQEMAVLGAEDRLHTRAAVRILELNGVLPTGWLSGVLPE
jgi:hypothetical protein